MKTFLFMYPDHDILEYESRTAMHLVEKEWLQTPKGREIKKRLEPYKKTKPLDKIKEKEPIWAEARDDLARFFFPTYCAEWNACIEQRYRSKGYQIVFALLDNEEMEPLIRVTPQDKVIYVGMDWKTHSTKKPEGGYHYPDNDYILNQVFPTEHLRVGGFHFSDCVQRISQGAFNRGVDVLVDEDLTDLFGGIWRKNPQFKRDTYPSHKPFTTKNGWFWHASAHAGRPWMLQWNPDGTWYLPSFSRITRSQ